MVPPCEEGSSVDVTGNNVEVKPIDDDANASEVVISTVGVCVLDINVEVSVDIIYVLPSTEVVSVGMVET